MRQPLSTATLQAVGFGYIRIITYLASKVDEPMLSRAGKEKNRVVFYPGRCGGEVR
jgi:hypothetical protein